MENIENEYNKRFGNKKLLNDSFDADGLWDAINDELDEGVGSTDNTSPPPSGYLPR